jgi:hypothetical protein
MIKEPIYNTLLFIFKGNRNFFKLIDEFHDKLPPKHKRAKESFDNTIHMSVIDTTDMKMNLTPEEIDLFHKKLENFNYNLIFFKRKAIKNYSSNLQRLLRTSDWDKLGIAIIQSLIEDDKKSKPYLFGYKIGKIIRF